MKISLQSIQNKTSNCSNDFTLFNNISNMFEVQFCNNIQTRIKNVLQNYTYSRLAFGSIV